MKRIANGARGTKAKSTQAPAVETFLVRFERFYNGRVWEVRMPRPVTDAAILKVLKRLKIWRNADCADTLSVESTSDYGGQIYVDERVAGAYFIVPGSNETTA